MSLKLLASLLGFISAVSGLPNHFTPQTHVLQRRSDANVTDQLTPTILFEFPNPTWLENFAIRSNGELLINLATEPSMYLFNPISQAAPTKLFTLPGYLALLGIVEATPDVFYFVAGNFSTTTAITIPGSYSLFKIDLGPFSCSTLPVKVIDMPKASFLNGLALLSNTNGDLNLVVTDSGLGLVWKVDVSKGEYEVFIDVPEMKIAVNASIPLGVNGVHLRDSYLYFTSITQALYCRISVEPSATGYSIGPVETLATDITSDDFTLDRYGNGWIATNPTDMIDLVIAQGKKTGEVFTVAGAPGTSLVAGATACSFGRTKLDKDILYIVTSGSGAGGKVLALNTTGYLAGLLG
jgi:hypothetical protein